MDATTIAQLIAVTALTLAMLGFGWPKAGARLRVLLALVVAGAGAFCVLFLPQIAAWLGAMITVAGAALGLSSEPARKSVSRLIHRGDG